MSQQKAASLSSSLFARKGRASPASLLVSELEGSTPEQVAAEAAHDLHDAHDGEELKRSALALNGRAGRRKADEELPLLAFVEAQVASEDSASGSQDAAKSRAERSGSEEVSEPAQAEPVADSLQPAASLLDRGAQALRKANGRSQGDCVETMAAAGPQAAEPEPFEADVPPAEVTGVVPDTMVEAATVSGDAQVTSIVDASLDDAFLDEAAAAVTAAGDRVAEAKVEPVETVAETAAVAENDGSAVDQTATVVVPEAAAAAEATASSEAEGAAPAQASEEKPETAAQKVAGAVETALPTGSGADVSSATSNIRPVPGDVAPAARPGLREAPVEAMPAPPPPASKRTLPWRSAAVIALGALFGLGAYIMASKPPQEPPVQVTIEAGTSAPRVPDAETAAAAPPAAGTATPQPEPSFDIIRIESDGQSIIAGRAEPFSEWILLNNGEPIASIKADANGEWVVLPDASLVPGANAFSLVPKAEQGKVAIPAPAAPTAPADAAPSELSPRSEVAPAPRKQAGERGDAVEADAAPATDVVLPRPKPQVPSFRVSEAGIYQVQVASVRQSADAERERQRLAAAYPQLLGKLELQVQEAAVEGAGTFYRVRSGAMADLGEARELCRRLDAAGQGCLVVRRGSLAGAAAATSPPEVVVEQPAEGPSPARQQAERPQ